jgi:diaminopimelate epimerase
MSSRRNKIIMDGGAVNIDWQDDGKAGGRVVMSGPVAYAYHGQMVGEVAALLEAANG